jgi:hypothetical protein
MLVANAVLGGTFLLCYGLLDQACDNSSSVTPLPQASFLFITFQLLQTKMYFLSVNKAQLITTCKLKLHVCSVISSIGYADYSVWASEATCI